MARSTWKGVISFGMVSIPVHLAPATRPKDVSFRMLHEKCKSKLREKRWCPVCDREVPAEEVVRGYEYAKERYVVMGEDDFEQLPLASKHTIGLQAFVKEDEIDPIYFEKSYFLEPEEAGIKGYTLLRRALEERGLVAIARIAMLRKERLCALRPAQDLLLLDTLHYADEIRQEDRPNVPKAIVSAKEMDAAESLIEALTERFDPESYRDEYRESLLELIQSKLADKDEAVISTPSKPKAATGSGDLLDALRASVAAAKKSGGRKRGATGGKTPAKAAAKAAVKTAAKTPKKRAA